LIKTKKEGKTTNTTNYADPVEICGQQQQQKRKQTNQQRKCNVNAPRAGDSEGSSVCGFAIKVWNVNVLHNLSFVCSQFFIAEIIGCLPLADGLLPGHEKTNPAKPARNSKNVLFTKTNALFRL
jgi:hypothetical protein